MAVVGKTIQIYLLVPLPMTLKIPLLLKLSEGENWAVFENSLDLTLMVRISAKVTDKEY